MMSMQWIRRACLAAPLVACCTAWGLPAHPAEDPQLDRATALVDQYYGDPALLDEAGKLVSESLARAPSAGGYTQAARIVIKGGHVVYDRFKPGSQVRASSLIEQALALDPNYAPALSLLFDSQLRSRDVAAACATAAKGLAADPSYPWMHIKMARCHLERAEFPDARAELETVVKGGAAAGREQSRAYVAALLVESSMIARPENVDILRANAAKMEAARDPHDAWTLGTIAEYFELAGDFDDAMVHANKALAVMDYGGGHAILASALYGKAAQLELAHKDNAALLAQARQQRVPAEMVMHVFESPGTSSELARLAPVVRKMLDH